MKILSCGAGMQSTALALMSCENALVLKRIGDAINKAWRIDEPGFAEFYEKVAPHPLVPIYDAVIFCDLGFEPPWVKKQVAFIQDACQTAGIFFKVLYAPLYADFTKNFGERRTISIPWWTLDDKGHKSKMPRNCTIDYKVEVISKYVRWELLGYRKGQRLRPEDIEAHELHMGFSFEEQKRCKKNPNRLFVNHFPLVEMKKTRANNYAYIRDTWGLETKASACAFCPFHRNYFFKHLKDYEPESYERLLGVDHLLRDKNPKPPMDSELFISRSRKRLEDLNQEDCDDAECFEYCGRQIWNGF